MTRIVLLPRNLESKLDNLTELVEEVNGILLYRPRVNECLLEAMFITGLGTEGHVISEQKRIELANQFFKKNPNYKFVRFHTHSKGTIKKYSSYFAKHFSQGDIDSIKEQLKLDRTFIAMLVTPERKLLSGIDNPHLEITPDSSYLQDRNNFISTALRKIAETKGYDISKFYARRSS